MECNSFLPNDRMHKSSYIAPVGHELDLELLKCGLCNERRTGSDGRTKSTAAHHSNLIMNNIDKNQPCPCGSTKKYKHCCQRKLKQRDAATHANVATVPIWLKLAMQNMQSGKFHLAQMVYEQVLQVKPKNVEAQQWLAVALHQQGKSERAIEIIKQCLSENSDIATVHSTFANILKAVGQRDEAIAHYKQALALRPDLADVHNNLGIALSSQGRIGEALESYAKAIALLPSYAEAHNNMGTALHANGLNEAAIAAYQHALALAPNYAQAVFNLGKVYVEDRPDQATDLVRKSLVIQPDLWAAWIVYANLLKNSNDTDQARVSLHRAFSINPSNGLKVESALMLPSIMGTRDEIHAIRTAFENNLDRLIDEQLVLSDPIAEFCGTNFLLAYHGLNDKQLQQKIARFYEQACPALLYIAPHCKTKPSSQQKQRIGFLSKFITKHSVALSFSRIVDAVAAQVDFEVVLISSHDPLNATVEGTYPHFSGRHIRIAVDLAAAREQVAALELDILVYLDIGMEPLSYFLAFSRLARAQCVLGGHPVTTGVRAVDYFLSSDMMERSDAQAHYSEQLVRQPFGMFYFERPNLPAVFKTRAELGLPEDEHIYLCPMTLHKLHPDFDEAIVRILQLDPVGSVFLVDDRKHSRWKSILQARFEKTVPQNLRDRIIFIPWVLDRLDFFSLNKAADVVLDPFHFGIGTTAIATCSVGTPFVTKPAEFMRGRVGLFYAKILGVMECVALDVEEYALKAVSIATQPALRDSIKAKILANNGALFDNNQAILDAVTFFRTIEPSPISGE